MKMRGILKRVLAVVLALVIFVAFYEEKPISSFASSVDSDFSYILYSDWGSGFNGCIRYTNNTGEIIEGWKISFSFSREITSCWNGEIVSHESDVYVIECLEYNSRIKINESIEIGFMGCGGSAADVPCFIHFVTEDGEQDNDYPAGNDSDETIDEPAGDISDVSSGDDLSDASGNDSDDTSQDLEDILESIDLSLDSDTDGVPDYVELIYGTLTDNTDSDGDGLSDYDEIYTLNTNPLCADSDNDDIPDTEEDEDYDGLSNIMELRYGTYSDRPDSDCDGLNDYDEIFRYNTNPVIYDSDGDGASDGYEIEAGYNPTEINPVFDSITGFTDDFGNEIIVFVKYAGMYVNIIDTKLVESSVSTEALGCLSNSISIVVPPDAEANVRITLSELVDSSEASIYRIDERTHELIPVETFINDNVVEAVIPETGIYVLLDMKEFEKNYIWLDEVSNTTGYCGAIEIIVSVSNRENEQAYISRVKSALEQILSEAPENIYIHIGYYKSGDYLGVSKWFYGASSAYNSISRFDEGLYRSNGAFYCINAYLSKLTSFGRSEYIVLADELSNDEGKYPNAYSELKRRGITVSTICLDDSDGNNYLERLSAATSGEYCAYYDISPVINHVRDINTPGLNDRDADGDGLIDRYEPYICLQDGTRVKLYSDIPDCDSDFLLDGDEIEVDLIHDDSGKVAAVGILKSNPLMKDSDMDGIDDKNDANPLFYDFIEPFMVYHSAKDEGFDGDLNPCQDLKYGKQSEEEILQIRKQFSKEIKKAKDNEVDKLYSEYIKMSKRFASADMHSVIDSLAANAKDGNGTVFENDILSERVYEHESTQEYIRAFKREFIKRIIKNKGDISKLLYDKDMRDEEGTFYSWIQNNTMHLYFDEFADKINGLGIIVHDTEGNYVEITEYSLTGTHFKGVLHFTIFDNYGLDKVDVTKKYGKLEGFRSWYVLQHYDEIKGAYVPFITHMGFDVEFEGDL